MVPRRASFLPLGCLLSFLPGALPRHEPSPGRNAVAVGRKVAVAPDAEAESAPVSAVEEALVRSV